MGAEGKDVCAARHSFCRLCQAFAHHCQRSKCSDVEQACSYRLVLLSGTDLYLHMLLIAPGAIILAFRASRGSSLARKDSRNLHAMMSRTRTTSGRLCSEANLGHKLHVDGTLSPSRLQYASECLFGRWTSISGPGLGKGHRKRYPSDTFSGERAGGDCDSRPRIEVIVGCIHQVGPRRLVEPMTVAGFHTPLPC